jgi:hypothetical protein
MRIVAKHPGLRWNQVWINIHHPALTDKVKTAWYMAVHGIVPTNAHLAAKHISTTYRCIRCKKIDTLPHRLFDCQEEGKIWSWTKGKLSQIMRMHPKHIPDD